jgi:hypothetical protein
MILLFRNLFDNLFLIELSITSMKIYIKQKIFSIHLNLLFFLSDLSLTSKEWIFCDESLFSLVDALKAFQKLISIKKSNKLKENSNLFVVV